MKSVLILALRAILLVFNKEDIVRTVSPLILQFDSDVSRSYVNPRFHRTN